jgi:hypothetical protein
VASTSSTANGRLGFFFEVSEHNYKYKLPTWAGNIWLCCLMSWKVYGKLSKGCGWVFGFRQIDKELKVSMFLITIYLGMSVGRYLHRLSTKIW